MRKHSEIIKSADELYARLTEDFGNFKEAKSEKVNSLAEVSYEQAHGVVEELVSGARSIIEGCFSEDGVTFPKYLVNFTTYTKDEKMTEVSIVIKSKLKDAIKYKREFTIEVGDNFMGDFIKAHVDAIFDMYYREQANNNLKDVNSLINKICTEHSIPYTFEFTLSDGKEYVTYIDNDVVIFNASLEAALEISKHELFLSGDEYFDLVRDQQIEKLVDVLSVTHTTTQLIKANIDIVNTLVGYKTKKRADRLIRIAYHKKAEHLNKVKSGFGYYEKEDENGSIFAILEKHADGSITVALNPFDVKTLLNVDVDVLSEVKEILA